MKAILAALLLTTALPCSAHACSGTALEDVQAGPDDHFVSIKKGETQTGMNTVLRDKRTGAVGICLDDECFPAMIIKDGVPHETMKLQDCEIASKPIDDSDGLETYDVAKASEPDDHPAQDDVHPTTEMKKMLAAAVVMQSLSQTGNASIIVDSASSAHLKEDPRAKITKVSDCKFFAVYPSQRWRFTLDVSKLTGAYQQNNGKLLFQANGQAHCWDFGSGKMTCWNGTARFMNSFNAQQVIHDIKFLLNNGCGQSVRGPDPY